MNEIEQFKVAEWPPTKGEMMVTKNEIISALDKYDDDAELLIKLDDEDYAISGVEGTWDVASDGHTQIDSTGIAFIVGEI